MQRILLLCISLFSGCSHMAHDQWSGQDKAQHFIASAILLTFHEVKLLYCVPALLLEEKGFHDCW